MRASTVLLAAVINAAPFAAEAQARQAASPAAEAGLPELHVVRRVSLGPTYSCRPPADFARGYAGTALFLSDASRSRNAPELLFDGACGSLDTFSANLTGDDFSLIADLGPNVPIEEVSAHRALNWRSLATAESFSRFVSEIPVVEGHTYAVVLNSQERRGLFVLTVNRWVPNVRVDLSYAVKHYQLLRTPSAFAPGFSWENGNASRGVDPLVRVEGEFLVVEKEVLLNAPVSAVWRAFTVSSEAQWLAPSMEVEARPGGRWGSRAPGASAPPVPGSAPVLLGGGKPRKEPGKSERTAPGSPTGLSGRVLSLVPLEQISVTGEIEGSWVTWRLFPLEGGKTRVVYTGTGSSAEWKKGYRKVVDELDAPLARLRARFPAQR
ncbi:MAG: SRPBCC domain-containing protein [Acidobacteria bacterium]|nr:SRPBCC domain-containing protein [Acidobacteriota bacterium]